MQLDPTFKPPTAADAAVLMEGRRTAALSIGDPTQRRMVQNGLLHAMLEVSGQHAQIFERALIVDEPVYKFFQFEQPMVGKAAVMNFYDAIFGPGAASAIGDVHHLATASWGFTSQQTNLQFVDEARASAFGLADGGAQAAYVVQRPVCLIWHFEAHSGRLEGERLYFAPASACRYTPIRPDQLLTTDALACVLQPVLARTWEDHAQSSRQIAAAHMVRPSLNCNVQ